MIVTVTEQMFIDAILTRYPGRFSLPVIKDLFEYYEEDSSYDDEELLDIVALCDIWDEYAAIEEIKNSLDVDSEGLEGLGMFKTSEGAYLVGEWY